MARDVPHEGNPYKWLKIYDFHGGVSVDIVRAADKNSILGNPVYY